MIDYSPSPEAYASNLARYISNPSTIRARTLEWWGRAPSVERCKALRDKHVQKVSFGESREIYKAYKGNFQCGHERSEENSHWLETGTQVCKTCRRERMAEAQRRSREKKRKDREAIERILKAEKKLAERKRRESEAEYRKERLNSVFVNELVAKVCDVFCCSQEDFYGRKRSKHLVIARSVFVRLMRDREASYPQIQRRLRMKCHTSAINLNSRFDHYCAEYPHVRSAYKALK